MIIFILLILQLNCRVKPSHISSRGFFQLSQYFIDNFKRSLTVKADSLDIISVALILCEKEPEKP